MRSRKLALGLGLLTVVAFSVPAFAQGTSTPAYPPACAGSSVTPAKSDEAHAFYNAGRALYDEGNYDGAIAQFREAYRRDCSKHDLLIIISRSYELKGDRPEAVKALELFLDRQKDSPDAATHRTKIENLKKQIAAQPPPAPTASATPPPVEIREHTIPPWVVVGIGGAAVVAGFIVLVTAPSFPDGCSTTTNTCSPAKDDPNPNAAKDLESTAASHTDHVTGGAIAMGAGGVLLLGGLLWHFLEPTGPVTTTGAVRPTLLPSIAPGHAGLSLSGVF